ncbi:MAG: hypothetical protein EHM42_04445 [Planctomycetaceae bacterium]|nr:MAG: hypothetical protein EHM42_04445 [Planctomycetaceae bacterium]
MSVAVVAGCCVLVPLTARADDSPSNDDQKFHKILNSPAEIRVDQDSVFTILQRLAQQYGLSLVYDEVAFTPGADRRDDRVTLEGSGVTLRSILHQILSPRDLTWRARDGKFEITSRERADEELVLRSYRLAGLARTDTEEAELAKLVAKFVTPDLWTEVGGPGDLRAVRGGLLVRQSLFAHEELAGFLREIARKTDADVDDSQRFGTEHQVIRTEDQIREILSGRIDVKNKKLELERCLDYLRDRHRLPVWYDERLLREAGADTKDVTLELKQASLENILNRILEPSGLAWMIEDEAITIVDNSAGNGSVRIQLHSVAGLPDDLVLPVSNLPGNPAAGGMGGGGSGGVGFFQFGGGGMDGIPSRTGMSGMAGGTACSDSDTGLAGLVQALIAPDNWVSTGGEGRIVRFRDCLVVRQGAGFQREIALLLRDLQRIARDVDPAARGPGAAVETNRETRLYRLRGESAETVRQMLMTLDESTIWNAGAALGNANGGRIAVLKDGLVIQQKPDDHRRIRRWLERLELLDGVVELDEQAEVSGEPSNIATGHSKPQSTAAQR